MSRTSSFVPFFKIVPSTLVRILRAIFIGSQYSRHSHELLVGTSNSYLFCSDQVILLVFSS